MNVALVCIAKNEENYIEEWIKYHLKIGFDDIFIYQNDWRWNGEHVNTHKLIMDGLDKQRESYNHFIQTNTKYNWCAFLDVDEFLVLKKHNNVKDFINEYKDFQSIGINWVLFGNNGYEKFNGNYSVINRFTKCESTPNPHIKSIVNIENKNIVMDVHNPISTWINTNKKPNTGPYNFEKLNDIAQINHYFCKSREEFELKCQRGRADSAIYRRSINEYDGHNHNEIDDFTAYNIYNN